MDSKDSKHELVEDADSEHDMRSKRDMASKHDMDSKDNTDSKLDIDSKNAMDSKQSMDSKHDLPPPSYDAEHAGGESSQMALQKSNEPLKKPGVWGSFKSMISITQSPEQRAKYLQQCEEEETKRWGAPGAQKRDIAARYQVVVGLQHLATERDKKYLKRLRKGYFEPIPLAWSINPYGPLTQPVLGSFFYDDAGEERLYWTLNHAVHDGKPRLKSMPRTETQELYLAAQRARRAQSIDMGYISKGDAFLSNDRYRKKGYTRQVPALPIHKAFSEMQHLVHDGKIKVDTMILLDVSSSMGWDHMGFDQPRHIHVVHNILRRAISHMETRDQYPDSQGHKGVETVMFNSASERLGKIDHVNFETQWQRIQARVYGGGGTCVMSGWNQCKKLHFELHGGNGNAYYDEVFGWQANASMPKLSLLVMLDGEAIDMDEFELELLGETWCYTTIVLIGQEDCPNHHRHANELERICAANDHIQFYDCHGRICERLVVHDVLQRVYAENAPDRNEILDPHFDLPPPAYSKHDRPTPRYAGIGPGSPSNLVPAMNIAGGVGGIF